MLTGEISRWWDFAQATESESFLSLSINFQPFYDEEQDKTKLPIQRCHGIQFHWHRVESIQIGRKNWCKMCDSVCIWVCDLCSFETIVKRFKHWDSPFFSFSHYCCCTAVFGGCAQINHSNAKRFCRISKKNSKFNGTYSSNICLSACLVCTVHSHV